MVGLDILSGLPRTSDGNKHLLVVVDHFSRWCEVYPLKDMSASSVASVFVNEFVARFGVPSRIHSDQGGCFVGELLTKTCALLGIARSAITSYHPQGNGVVERMNRTILSMLSKYLEENAHSEWDQHLPMIMLGYRSQIHRSLRLSPYEVLFGRRVRLPADVALDPKISSDSRPIAEFIDRLKDDLKVIHHEALAASDASHRSNKELYEKINSFHFVPGQTVRLHKLAVPRGQYYKFVRPYKRARILACVGPLNYRVKVEGRQRPLLVHHNRLSPCAGSEHDATADGSAVLGKATDLAAGGKVSRSKGDSRKASSVSLPTPVIDSAARILNPLVPIFCPRMAVGVGASGGEPGPCEPVGFAAGVEAVPRGSGVTDAGGPVPGTPDGARGRQPEQEPPPPPPLPEPAPRRSTRVSVRPDRLGII